MKNSEKSPSSRKKRMKVPETGMSWGLKRAKRRGGTGEDGEIGAVEGVGSQRPPGPKSEIGVLF